MLEVLQTTRSVPGTSLHCTGTSAIGMCSSCAKYISSTSKHQRFMRWFLYKDRAALLVNNYRHTKKKPHQNKKAFKREKKEEEACC